MRLNEASRTAQEYVRAMFPAIRRKNSRIEAIRILIPKMFMSPVRTSEQREDKHALARHPLLTFDEEGLHRRYARLDGDWVDAIAMARIRPFGG